MSWFSRLFGGHKEPIKEQLSMSLTELSSIIEENLHRNTEQFTPDLKNFYSQMQSSADRMQEKLNILSKAVPTEKVDFQLLKIASSHRDESVRKLDSMLKEFRKQISINLDSFVDFHNSCMSSLKITNEKLARSFSIFEQVFSKESGSLMSEYKKLYKLLEDIGEYLKEKKLVVGPLNEIRNYIETIKALLSGINQNKSVIENLNSELEILKNKADSLKKRIENLISSKEWNLFQNTLKDIELIAVEVDDVEGEIVQTISSIERTLKKYNKLPDSRGKKLIELYLKDPIVASLSDKNQAGINDVMNSVETAILENKIIVGDKKERSILDKIKGIKNGSLELLVKRYEELQNRKHELDRRLEEIEIKKVEQSLELELSGTNNSISDIEDRIRKLININNIKYEEIGKMKTSLEKMVQVALNQNITIDISGIDINRTKIN